MKRCGTLTDESILLDIPDDVLHLRIKESQRRKDIFRSASTFEDVLARQQKSEASAPKISEAVHFFGVSRVAVLTDSNHFHHLWCSTCAVWMANGQFDVTKGFYIRLML
ncbi:hypothetical protein [Paenibacillus pseudetheri]|uniref:hypothetical protein n=1 Tax=Paenibacillus pseudetheri TaxID=2897682 RepID=UPI001F1E3000|nr:hypothetical protein [Paenibacillus pseudetheri]